ncbi:hypothetical protein IEQ34_005177 [Dendrobium chrysotoxum]|uniref:Uncharacterized protein n=1 Tax=Dendrobium chrysotoxum TaxID=161865 RepID=A0AAV7GUB1_DENCH|nr:hypothetical protein IEQ34_005177 [Dendrobium chrysotoxum]
MENSVDGICLNVTHHFRKLHFSAILRSVVVLDSPFKNSISAIDAGKGEMIFSVPTRSHTRRQFNAPLGGPHVRKTNMISYKYAAISRPFRKEIFRKNVIYQTNETAIGLLARYLPETHDNCPSETSPAGMGTLLKLSVMLKLFVSPTLLKRRTVGETTILTPFGSSKSTM